LPELIGAARISKRYEEENEQNRLRIDEWVKGIFSSILQNRKEPSMLLQVLRGSLILDITKGNVVVTEYEKEFFERLISNRSTQLDNKIEEMRL
jgi:hypothetical protein